MRYFPQLLTFVVALHFVPASADAEPVRYKLSADGSSIVARLFKAGLGKRWAHDHFITSKSVRGEVVIDPQDPNRSKISVVVPTKSLIVDLPAVRKRYGANAIDKGARAKIEKHMRAKDQLDTARYKTISFRSARVSRVEKNRYRVKGYIALRGVSRPVTLEVRATISQNKFRGGGSLTLKQSSFGYKPYSALLGLVKLQDTFKLDIYLEGARQGALSQQPELPKPIASHHETQNQLMTTK